MKNFEVLSVYENTEDGIFIVQPMARHPIGASAEFGAPTLVPDAQFDTHIATAVMENLAKYHKQVYDQDTAAARSDKEQRDFVKAHLNVSLTRYPSGEICIYPMRRKSGGYTGTGEKIVLRADEVPENLASALREAFSKSS